MLNCLKNILNKEYNIKDNSKIHILRLEFLELNNKLKKYGKTLCKFHGNRKSNHGSECRHPAMNWGGISRNTDCKLTNCPRILYGDEGK